MRDERGRLIAKKITTTLSTSRTEEDDIFDEEDLDFLPKFLRESWLRSYQREEQQDKRPVKVEKPEAEEEKEEEEDKEEEKKVEKEEKYEEEKEKEEEPKKAVLKVTKMHKKPSQGSGNPSLAHGDDVYTGGSLEKKAPQMRALLFYSEEPEADIIPALTAFLMREKKKQGQKS